jgi:PAS domain S-box-containing protein
VTGKILIVEDEPIVALDLQQEIEQLGCEVVGLAESADEALMAVNVCRPDLALMDVRIVGSMDGVQTARLLRSLYRIPSIFLTSYCDDKTIARAARALPYGYLTKPFQSGELKATLRVALHKARVDALQNATHRKMAATMSGMREGVLMLSPDGRVQFMNAAAEAISGWTLTDAKGKLLIEVLSLIDNDQKLANLLELKADSINREEFGWAVQCTGRAPALVDLCMTPLANLAGQRSGFVVTVRDAAQRMRSQVIEETYNEGRCFDQTPTAMVQLDEFGCIVRVNQALLRESGVGAESLVGRSLTGLSMDPDPRIAKDLMHMLLKTETFMASPLRHTVD